MAGGPRRQSLPGCWRRPAAGFPSAGRGGPPQCPAPLPAERRPAGRGDAAARPALAGRRVLLVTHDPLEAIRLGARICLLAAGRFTEIEALPGAIPHGAQEAGFGRIYETVMARLMEAE